MVFTAFTRVDFKTRSREVVTFMQFFGDLLFNLFFLLTDMFNTQGLVLQCFVLHQRLEAQLTCDITRHHSLSIGPCVHVAYTMIQILETAKVVSLSCRFKTAVGLCIELNYSGNYKQIIIGSIFFPFLYFIDYHLNDICICIA